jgi:hypothetical protein
MFVKFSIFLFDAGGWSLSGYTFFSSLGSVKSTILFMLSVGFLLLRGWSVYLNVKKNRLKWMSIFGESKRRRSSKKSEMGRMISKPTLATVHAN